MSDEAAPQPPIKTAWLIGTLAAFALFAVIAAYSSRMTWDYADYDQQRADERKVTLATVQKAENALLSAGGWVDQAKGAIRIPIEEAMAREIDTLKGKPAAIGAVIPPPVPPAPAKAAPAKPAAFAAGVPASTNAAPATSALVNQPVFNKKNTKPSVSYGGVPINPSTGATNAAPTAAGPAAATAQPNEANP